MELSPEQRKANVLEFLKDNHVMHVATTSKDIPNIAVLVYVVDEQLNLYFITYKNSKKVAQLQENNRIQVAVWEHDTMLVEIEGRAVALEDEERKHEVVQVLADTATHEARFWPPIFRLDDAEHVLFKITPEFVRVLDVTQKTPTHTELPFVEVSL